MITLSKKIARLKESDAKTASGFFYKKRLRNDINLLNPEYNLLKKSKKYPNL